MYKPLFGTRGYAIYKDDKTPWTQEEYTTVRKALEIEEGEGVYSIHESDTDLSFIYDDKGSADKSNYHMWPGQKPKYSPEKYAIITYKQFLQTIRPKLLKRKRNEAKS